MSTENEMARRGIFRRCVATEDTPTQYRLARGPAAREFRQRSAAALLQSGDAVAATGKVSQLLAVEDPRLPPRLTAEMYQVARAAADTALSDGEDAADAFLHALPLGTKRRWLTPFIEKGRLEFRYVWRKLDEPPPPTTIHQNKSYSALRTDYFLLP